MWIGGRMCWIGDAIVGFHPFGGKLDDSKFPLFVELDFTGADVSALLGENSKNT